MDLRVNLLQKADKKKTILLGKNHLEITHSLLPSLRDGW